jgi:hypothetical protein
MVFMGGLGHGLADGGPSTRDIMELIRKLFDRKTDDKNNNYSVDRSNKY